MNLGLATADEFTVKSQNSVQAVVVNPFFYEIPLQEMVHLTLNILKRDIMPCISISGENFLIQFQSELRSEILSGKYIGYYIIGQTYYTRIGAPNNFLLIDKENNYHWYDKRDDHDLIVNGMIAIDFLPDIRHNMIKKVLQRHLKRQSR